MRLKFTLFTALLIACTYAGGCGSKSQPLPIDMWTHHPPVDMEIVMTRNSSWSGDSDGGEFYDVKFIYPNGDANHASEMHVLTGETATNSINRIRVFETEDGVEETTYTSRILIMIPKNPQVEPVYAKIQKLINEEVLEERTKEVIVGRVLNSG